MFNIERTYLSDAGWPWEPPHVWLDHKRAHILSYWIIEQTWEEFRSQSKCRPFRELKNIMGYPITCDGTIDQWPRCELNSG